MKRLYPLFLLMLFTFCKGQVKTDVPKDHVIESKIAKVGQPKIIKTQDTNQYDNVGCGLQDKTGNLWFATKGEGVYCYDGKSFFNYTEKDGLSSNFVWSILEDNAGKLWFGTADGVTCYDGKNFTVIPITTITGNYSHIKTKRDSYGMPYPNENSVWTIMQDRKGTFWFGTSNGIYLYDGKIYTHFLNDNGITKYTGVTFNKGKAFGVEHILEDKKGNIWFGGRGTEGVLRYDGKKLESYNPKGEHWLWPLMEDKKGNIWFSSWWGACYYDGKSFINLTTKDGLCDSNTTCILEDKNGDLWFGSDSEYGGLCHYNGKSYNHFTTKDGLTHNSVWCIVEDKIGNLWVGTRNTGLCRYDGKTFTKYSE